MSPPAPATGGDLDTEDGHAGPTLTYYVLLGVAHDVSVKDGTYCICTVSRVFRSQGQNERWLIPDLGP